MLDVTVVDYNRICVDCAGVAWSVVWNSDSDFGDVVFSACVHGEGGGLRAVDVYGYCVAVA